MIGDAEYYGRFWGFSNGPDRRLDPARPVGTAPAARALR